MRKLIIYLLSLSVLILLVFASAYSIRVLNTDLSIPHTADTPESDIRLVLITSELDTPFWDKVKEGALAAARSNGASLEVWGSYGKNEQDFLKQMEIAITSKVDGIIVQGLDTAEFKHLAMYKATEKGIPIITVANDVPMNESLRRTYVGSNHYEAGQMLARQLLSDMGFSGKVVLMASNRQEEFQRSRLKGILEVLQIYPEIHTKIVGSGTTREEVVQATNQVLNDDPEVKAIITTTALNASAIIQEIGKRTLVEPYFIYSFDDSPETMTLLQQGKIDALITQSPEAMGETSVKLMMQWLQGKQLPLNTDGYYTGIRVRKAEVRQ
ncbi:sugar ABC transporter substrate-binding protein [Cohnella kolymensis]|uniref:Sugar ABC transporter substrate-binding protein n=1 Tax=Cohnella kolymensis TaxID=1590652 RepID=A0ABR5A201_9BACL|nr:substrate-binding domain-containing protein [Cohnella kolymensis]KIL35086.1 sugar ABC transporter substrate-binding protein [Cohnella kolymensis]